MNISHRNRYVYLIYIYIYARYIYLFYISTPYIYIYIYIYLIYIYKYIHISYHLDLNKTGWWATWYLMWQREKGSLGFSGKNQGIPDCHVLES